jgi:hypothetical protein
MAGKKTFVAGEVLLAQDVNDYLMDQSVMNFASDAARSSAIPTPTEGMVSYVSDTGSESPTSTIPQIQAYTGSAWQNMDGMTLLATVPVTSATTLTVDNVFVETFDNYKMILNMSAVGTGGFINMQYRNATPATLGTNDYYWVQNATSASTNVPANLNTQPSLRVATVGVSQFYAETNVYTPFPASRDTWSENKSITYDGTAYRIAQVGGQYALSASVRGFVINFPGASTGSVSVYGMRKS